MGAINKMLGVPSARKQAAQSVAAAKAAENNRPARSAEEAKETEATILETETSEVTNVGTEVGVVRAKKNARKGVPGLGL